MSVVKKEDVARNNIKDMKAIIQHFIMKNNLFFEDIYPKLRNFTVRKHKKISEDLTLITPEDILEIQLSHNNSMEIEVLDKCKGIININKYKLREKLEITIDDITELYIVVSDCLKEFNKYTLLCNNYIKFIQLINILVEYRKDFQMYIKDLQLYISMPKNSKSKNGYIHNIHNYDSQLQKCTLNSQIIFSRYYNNIDYLLNDFYIDIIIFEKSISKLHILYNGYNNIKNKSIIYNSQFKDLELDDLPNLDLDESESETEHELESEIDSDDETQEMYNEKQKKIEADIKKTEELKKLQLQRKYLKYKTKYLLLKKSFI